MHEHTCPHYPHIPHTHTHTHHAYTIRSTTTRRLDDRGLLEITGTFHDSVGNASVAIPLWLHAIEVVDYFWE